MAGVSFPPVLQILPRSTRASLKTDLEYHVEMDPRRKFNSRQVAALRRTLGDFLRAEYTAAVSTEGSRLIVRTTPADTMDEVEFHVLSTLQAILKPKVPHSAIGFHLSDADSAKWFAVSVRVVGYYTDMSQIRAIHAQLKNLPGVLTSRPKPDDNCVIRLTINGNWKEQMPPFIEKAAAQGVSIAPHELWAPSLRLYDR
ncbi:MAG TPA: hypothetical protein VFZ48_00830 [Candidatus Saccharimonadales bacterium]